MFSFRKTEIIQRDHKLAIVSGFVNPFSGRSYTFCFAFCSKAASPHFHDRRFEIQALPYRHAIELTANTGAEAPGDPPHFGRYR